MHEKLSRAHPLPMNTTNFIFFFVVSLRCFLKKRPSRKTATAIHSPRSPQINVATRPSGVLLAFVNKRPKPFKDETPRNQHCDWGCGGRLKFAGLCFSFWAFFRKHRYTRGARTKKTQTRTATQADRQRKRESERETEREREREKAREKKEEVKEKKATRSKHQT